MNELLNEAKKWLLCGDLSTAKKIYLKILSEETKNGEALHGLSFISFQEKKYEEAKEYLKKALSSDPFNVEFYSSLAVICENLGQASESCEALEKAKKIIEEKQSFDNLKNIKVILSLCEIYIRLQRYEEAKILLKITLQFHPENFEALKALAQCYVGLCLYHHAIKTLEKLPLNPAILEALKVEVFLLKRDYRNALMCAEKCVSLEKNAKFYSLLGECYIKTQQLEKAIVAYKEGLKFDPCQGLMLSRLLAVQIRVCEWKERNEIIARLRALLPTETSVSKNIQPTIAILAGFTNQELLSVAKSHSKVIEEAALPLRDQLNFIYSEKKTSKLRIGYLSSDFHDHATLHLLLDVFKFHDKNKFEVYAYSFGEKNRGPYRKKMLEYCDHFVNIRFLSDKEAALKINQDAIDILVDLKGHISDHRLGIPALRPAPLQIHYLGYPGTIGADFIDYLIADNYVIPNSERKYYSESLIYMPLTYQANTSEKKISKKIPHRKDYNLPDDVFVFCCFNQNDKYDPETVSLWMKILSSVPKSVLWLWGNYERLKEKLELYGGEYGVEKTRFIVSPAEPSPKHLARMKLADLFLDTLQYSAHTSCSDAIRIGLPVLTVPGKTFASRVAASLLDKMGAQELIASSCEEYVEKAVQFAQAPQELKEIKNKILINRKGSGLYNPVLFTKHLENAYTKIWKRHLKELPPEDLFIT